MADSWNPSAAAAYLDQRESEWVLWPPAERDHDTFCVSCHTVLPYALARPALRTSNGESALTANERKLLDNVSRRVRLGTQVEPFYSGSVQKTLESRGTEAVLNALILASYAGRSRELGADTQTAVDTMWGLQQTTGDECGSWPWLQFNMEPWEARYSRFYGAALAAVAIGLTPEEYRARPEVQNHVKLLEEYLVRESSKQPSLNRAALLWASTRLPELLDWKSQTSIVSELFAKQEPDGGWSLHSLVIASGMDWTRDQWKQVKGVRSSRSDGYATGFVAFTLQQAGVGADNTRVGQALQWLKQHQSQAEGFWPATSLNQRRDLHSQVGRFMSDAATAYAVLALTAGTNNSQRTAISSTAK